MTEHEKRLAKLASLGWTCEHPHMIHQPVSHGKQHLRSVYLEGLINEAPREAFLSIGCGMVMLLRGEDFTFDHFIDLLEGRLPMVLSENWNDRQKELFDGEAIE